MRSERDQPTPINPFFSMWVITRDLFEDGKDVSRCSVDYSRDEHSKLTHGFRMRDGDAEVLYERLSNEGQTERGFEPLDEFGEGYVG